jgi:hypothetical protein
MAGSLAKLRRLSRGERRLLFKAWIYLLAARGALAILPFPRVRSLAASPGRGPERRHDPFVVARTKRLVDIAAARHLGSMTCLPRSLALQRLLGEQGITTEIKIGVHKEGGTLSAHAWLESGGEPLSEPEGISARYATLAGADRVVTREG